MEIEASIPQADAMPPSPSSSFAEFPQVERCLQQSSADKLEEYVKVATSIIGKLRGPLNDAKDDSNASRFLKVTGDLKSRIKTAPTLIGVVGNTGSGKSSVINAILDEEMLVPTNCMRACTAVITEMSYNHSDNPAALYRAEVEFISTDDWKKELMQLYDDLVDSNGEVTRDSSNSETEAGVAWAKIKAVYPQGTKETLTKTNPAALVNAPDVRRVLGSTQIITEATSEAFYVKMQKFIDSQEKDRRQKKKGEKKPMEFWPLIKVVRVFTKADALSTGAVIVDLPGVHDSNAARAAVADKYLEKCTGLWIVAPVTRAVDDKTAQNMLGQSFKLQLKYDDKYSHVTFICSKTDDILIAEAVKSLGLEDQIAECQSNIDRTKSELVVKKPALEETVKRTQELQVKNGQIQEKIDHWQELADRFNESDIACSPSTIPQKRKNPTRQATNRRKIEVSLAALEAGSSSSESDEGEEAFVEDDIEDGEPEQEALSKERIQSELERLRGEKAQLQVAIQESFDKFEAESRPYRRQMKELADFEACLKSMCIQGRNKYSTNAIRHDFARGIKEMDQEIAMRENDELFDPEHDIRDYEQVAASLSVFCVSSRAYQKKKGRFKKDEAIRGFRTLEETGIPQLQAHAKQLTVDGRVNNAKRFLDEFGNMLNSLNLWVKDHGAEVQLSEGEKRDEVDKLQSELSVLCNTLNRAADLIVKECHDILTKNIYNKFDESIAAAAQAAVATVEKWFESKSSGGIPWNTFVATCRRDGSFQGTAGHRNFNEELISPLKQALVHSWERVFARRIPQALDKFPAISKEFLEKFHENVKGRIQEKTSFTSVNMLMLSLRGHISDITRVVKSFREQMTALHREASREFTPAIIKAMTEAYRSCVAETGQGSFGRMKIAMVEYVTTNRYSMFREATECVRSKLDSICSELEHELLAKINRVITAMDSEYKHVIIGKDLAQVSKAARDEISETLSQVEALFEIHNIREEPVIAVKIEDSLSP
ncbi:putative Dynamin N-terminal domain-containing protein [Seiridium unicorne]|uniref:Dynamin N-terminal domain-containing protein n=1 Tax=Seiridium unicorne TaxID=138068 RepID=A0ABR2UND5_9PEZI